jgi:predicted AlkP superfamily phosphohydrolase/phosphomutase
VTAAGPDSVVVVVSDHGAIPSGPWFNPAPILEEAGLLHYAEAGTEPGWADFVTVDPRPIDWSRTKAVPQRSVFVYVNLRGRDPEGIVEPGEEYEAVCEDVVRRLVAYVDPSTGRRPVALAMRRRDAPVLGLADEDDIGDVVYAVEPWYGAGHGQHLPTAERGIGALRALFVMAGPGVKSGVELVRRVGLEDIAPTLSHLLGLPVPLDADGGVIYQALEDPDGPARETRLLRDRYEKLRTAYERTMAISHSYTR